MPTQRLSMRRIRHLLTMHFGAGARTRAIARALGISPSTAREYLGRVAAAGITWPLDTDTTDESLMARLFVNGGVRLCARFHAEPDWPVVARELKRSGVNLMILREEYRADLGLRLPRSRGRFADFGATCRLLPIACWLRTGFGLGREPPAAQQLGVQRREEALGHGVVLGVADRSHRRTHASLSAAHAGRHGRVLAALIAVVDDDLGAPLAHGNLLRVQNQLGPRMARHRPANDLPAPRIQHDGQIQEPRRCRHISDVGHPKLVWPGRATVAVDQIRCWPRILVVSRNGCRAI